MHYVKLTDTRLRTYNHELWTVGLWKDTDGSGELCGPGFLHCYESDTEEKASHLSAMMNSTHANISSPRLWRVETRGRYLNDVGLKCGFTGMRIVEELALPVISGYASIRWGIELARLVPQSDRWNAWASGWVEGDDRTLAAAREASHNNGRSTISSGPRQRAELESAHWSAWSASMIAWDSRAESIAWIVLVIVRYFIEIGRPVDVAGMLLSAIEAEAEAGIEVVP